MDDNKAGPARSLRAGGGPAAGGFVVRQDGRKPLFDTNVTRQTTAPATHDLTRIPALARSKSNPGVHGRSAEKAAAMLGPASPVVATTPGGSRIPRFGSSSNFSNRKPMSLTEAYKLAGEEEVAGGSRAGPIDGSPSPAPRSWRMRTGGGAAGQDDDKMRDMMSDAHLDARARGNVSPNKERIAMRNRVDDGIGKSRTSRWVLEEGMRDSGLINDDPANIPLPSTENIPPEFEPDGSFAWQVDEDFTAGDLQISNSPRIRVNSNNNNGSSKLPFGAGRLGRSNSPIKPGGGTPNAKLAEIRDRELGLLPPPIDSPKPRTRTKLDDIRLREKEAEKQLPLLERGFPRIGAGAGHTKLDEIRKLETKGLSNREIAKAKLAEIKEFNAMARSVSPEEQRRQWETGGGHDVGNHARSKSAFESSGRLVPDTPVTIYKSKAEMIADDVRRAAEKRAEERRKASTTSNNKDGHPTTSNHRANALSPQKRDQSRDLLRRLARATSSSPAATTTAAPGSETQRQDEKRSTASGGTATASAPVPLKADAAPRTSSLKRSSLLPDDNGRRRTSNTSSNASKNTGTTSSGRPTVGFSGLARDRSSDSRKSQRSNMHSEQDPTDRIEAEEKLFAPLDNYSERGSVRAPSPLVDVDDEDEDDGRPEKDATTPRPTNKQDPMLLPTPRAPGAFVETPVTVKKEEAQGVVGGGLGLALRPSSSSSSGSRRRRASLESSGDVKAQPATLFRDKKTSLAWRAKDLDTASDPGIGTDSNGDDNGEKAGVKHRPRAKSLPRRRPLKNSAKLPSVRDDLKELQRMHDIDDTTLENLEEILLGKKSTNEKLDELLKEIPAVADVAREIKKEPPLPSAIDTDRLDDELAVYEKLGESVEREMAAGGGMTTANQKLSMLGGVFGATKSRKPSNQEKPTTVTTKATTTTTTEEKKHSKDHTHTYTHSKGTTNKCPLCVASPATHIVAYVHLPLPRLFYRRPEFRLTATGLVLLLVALWYAAETAMCGAYCRPATCDGRAPCVWDFDDPQGFGTALPIKLDQWLTRGCGRALYERWHEDVEDWMADVTDAVTGARLEDVQIQSLTNEQRRRHRRRMEKKGLGAGAGMTPAMKARAEEEARRAREEAAWEDEFGGWADEGGMVGGDDRVWP